MTQTASSKLKSSKLKLGTLKRLIGKRLIGRGLVALLLLGLSSSFVKAQDADDETAKEIAKKSGMWVLKWKHERPRWISLNYDLGTEDNKIPTENSGASPQLRTENYCYMYYEVSNKDDSDHRFFINITGVSDKKKTYHDVWDSAAFKKIEAILRYRGKIKKGEKLHSQKDITIPTKRADLDANPATRKLALPVIKAGETKKCVAIFRKLNVELDNLSINVRGLSNDLDIKSKEDHRRTIAEKILQLKYKRPGNEHYTSTKSLKFVSKKWIVKTHQIKTDLAKPKGD